MARHLIDTSLQDVRYAVRVLWKSPAFTLIASLTLALGIGANTTVFTLVNAALFRKIDAPEPDRLVWLASTRGPERRSAHLSYPEYFDYRDGSDAFAGLMVYQDVPLALGSGGEPQRITGMIVSGNYFAVLGLRPALGRWFAPEEDATPGTHPVAVVGHGLWQRRFGGDRGLVGRKVIVNGRPFTVIGVAPEGFVGTDLGSPVEMWVPMAMLAQVMPGQGELVTLRAASWLRAVGRLKPGVSWGRANAEIHTVAARLARAYPDVMGGGTTDVVPFAGGLDPANRGEAIPIFALLMAVPALVLLVACANVANLLLARAAARRREIGLRLALGATRARLVRQLLTESILLALLAGAAGVVLSFWISDLILAVAQAPAELAPAFRPDGRVLAFTFGLALATGVAFGLVPAVGSARADVAAAIKEEGSTLGRRVRRSRLMSGFVVAQVSLSLVLLVAAGLFVRSLRKAADVDPGFDTRNGLAISFDLGLQGYGAARREAFYRRLLERAAALPGVRSASLASQVPLSGRMIGTAVVPEGADSAATRQVWLGELWPDYFRTLGVPLVRGRDFSHADVRGAPPVAIVNETLARRLWPDADPLGKRLRLWGRDEPYREVTGVAKDGKYDELTEDARPFVYLPERQSTGYVSDMTLLVRSAGDPEPLVNPVRALLREMDPNLPLFGIHTLEQLVALRLDKQRGASSLLGVFGTLALMLAALGLYGVMAYAVTQRTREIGIRMALGAERAELLRLFVSEGVRLAALGVVIGVALAAALTRVLARFLYGVTPTDAATFVVGALVLAAVAALASYVPARRATQVDPMIALRSE